MIQLNYSEIAVMAVVRDPAREESRKYDSFFRVESLRAKAGISLEDSDISRGCGHDPRNICGF